MRGETTAATAVAPPVRPAGVGGDERYRSYDGEVRRGRSWWPWLIALGAAIAVSIGAWLFYDNVRDQIDANEPVAVDDYKGILEQKSVALIAATASTPTCAACRTATSRRATCSSRSPSPARAPKGSMVTILVSSGKKNVSVPSLVGESRDTAVKELTSLGLNADVHEVPPTSSPTWSPRRIHPRARSSSRAPLCRSMSSGPKPVAVPAVIGRTYDTAAAQLQAAGFTVGRAAVAESTGGEASTRIRPATRPPRAALP